ncbi:MAG: NAD+ synthase [Desulfonatronovibrio sp.]
MRIALLQLNPVVCDLKGNAGMIARAAQKGFEQGAQLCVTPEMAIMGYPPGDILFNREIIDNCLHAVKQVAEKTAELGPVLVGTPWRAKDAGESLYNGACLLNRGRVHSFFGKTLLPNYDVFDEKRYFVSSNGPGYFEIQGRKIGVTICEDVWNDKDFWPVPRYGPDPVQMLAEQKVDLILNMAASPFSLGKDKLVRDMLAAQARKHSIPVLFCNQVGGNDDLIFAGRSMALNEKGIITAQGRDFEEDLVVADTCSRGSLDCGFYEPSPEAEIWQALVLGLGDYMRKSGFSEALLGLSGGIDSALVAALAVQSIGPDNVTGVLMPSPYSSRASIDDSLELARNLGIKTITIPIDQVMRAYDSALDPVFSGMERDVTEENIQARIRGNLLMAISNKLGGLVLATGNKSELSVGYCTIYGDMAGGLAPISDVPKTLVYSLARWINDNTRLLIPRRIITKAPSAELSPGQKDQDTLPEYEVMDQILHKYIRSFHLDKEISAEGFDPETVARVVDMVQKAEFKRRQSPPGLKISDLAFGRGRRMPLAARCSRVTKR